MNSKFPFLLLYKKEIFVNYSSPETHYESMLQRHDSNSPVAKYRDRRALKLYLINNTIDFLHRLRKLIFMYPPIRSDLIGLLLSPYANTYD